MRHREDGSPIPEWSAEPDASIAPPVERTIEEVAEQDALEHAAVFCADDDEQADGYKEAA